MTFRSALKYSDVTLAQESSTAKRERERKGRESKGGTGRDVVGVYLSGCIDPVRREPELVTIYRRYSEKKLTAVRESPINWKDSLEGV